MVMLQQYQHLLNSKGQLTAAANVNIAIVQVTDFETAVEALFSVTDNGGQGTLTYSNGAFTYTGITDAQIKGLFAGTTGEIDYNSSNGQFSLPSEITQVTDFSSGLTAPTVAGSDSSTNVATTAWVQTNAPGTLINISTAGGLTGGPINVQVQFKLQTQVQAEEYLVMLLILVHSQ